MSVIPYNKVFWDNNNMLVLTQKQKESIGFFTDYGMLVNFSEGRYGKEFLALTHYDSSLYQNFYTFWDSATRFSLNRNLPQNRAYSQKQINKSILAGQYDLDLLNIQLLLDVSKVGTSYYTQSYTVFDERKSQFHYPDEPETRAFLNIFFDLCEIERREMQKSLESSTFTETQIDSVYFATIGKMKRVTRKYLGEVNLGKDKRALKSWNSVVVRSLGIDNVKIFIGTEGR